jgi:hypothetical protein
MSNAVNFSQNRRMADLVYLQNGAKSQKSAGNYASAVSVKRQKSFNLAG